MPKRPSSPLEAALGDLEKLVELVEAADTDTDATKARRLRLIIETAARRLAERAKALDPIRRPEAIFDPSNPKTAGRFVALTLVAQPLHGLGNLREFYGAGVYAIYYKGAFDAYAPLSGADHPIYVGKADPEDPAAKDAIGQGVKLFGRLNEHAKNIRKATSSLSIDDFECRFLIVQSGFQTAAEDHLINFFKPIWNSETNICYGLGKHGDSAGTRANKRSPWDTMHPGRKWADATTEDQKAPELIRRQIAEHFTRHPPCKDIHQILDEFTGHMRQWES